jgi:hypothetical protein
MQIPFNVENPRASRTWQRLLKRETRAEILPKTRTQVNK